MIKSLLYIRIEAQPPASYRIPLLEGLRQELPGITTFEFDNFSEESIRVYALELIKQSGRVVVMVQAHEPAAPISGLSSFFNRLFKHKPDSLLLVLQGEQPLLRKMMQAVAGEHFRENLSEDILKELLQRYFR